MENLHSLILSIPGWLGIQILKNRYSRDRAALEERDIFMS
jgi:hypothetical protein